MERKGDAKLKERHLKETWHIIRINEAHSNNIPL